MRVEQLGSRLGLFCKRIGLLYGVRRSLLQAYRAHLGGSNAGRGVCICVMPSWGLNCRYCRSERGLGLH